MTGDPYNDGRFGQERLDRIRALLRCSQCGGTLADEACGPTHAVLAADPAQHRALADPPASRSPEVDAARRRYLTDPGFYGRVRAASAALWRLFGDGVCPSPDLVHVHGEARTVALVALAAADAAEEQNAGWVAARSAFHYARSRVEWAGAVDPVVYAAERGLCAGCGHLRHGDGACCRAVAGDVACVCTGA